MARLLGLDPGTKRCGVAVSDSFQKMAFPRPALPVDDAIYTAITNLVIEEEIAGIVVGRPVSLAGNETASTEYADSFFAGLLSHLPEMAMEQFDERLTTHQAQRELSAAGVKAKDQRAVIDSAAAVVLLQTFLDGRLDA